MNGRRAFTIIEALIAIVMLIGVMLALLGILPSTFQFASRDSQAVQAATGGQQYLDALRHYVQSNGTNVNLPAAPIVAIDAGNSYMASGVSNASPGNFVLTNNGCPLVSGSSRMFDCVVSVAWTQDSQQRSVSVESYVTTQN
jgi:type II secretory pathway pseudopilin PulG